MLPLCYFWLEFLALHLNSRTVTFAASYDPTPSLGVPLALPINLLLLRLMFFQTQRVMASPSEGVNRVGMVCAGIPRTRRLSRLKRSGMAD